MRRTRKYCIRLLELTAVLIFLSACGTKAKAGDQARAERVAVDQAGYTCFVIRDENGRAVGGNCVKE